MNLCIRTDILAGNKTKETKRHDEAADDKIDKTWGSMNPNNSNNPNNLNTRTAQAVGLGLKDNRKKANDNKHRGVKERGNETRGGWVKKTASRNGSG
jgi:hypothetical protein